MPPHRRRTSPADLDRLKRIENAYWTLFAVLLVFLSATVILQYLTAEPGGASAPGGWYRRLLSVGLPGLVLLFSLYVTAKRQEIHRLKRDLSDRESLAERLKERTAELENALGETRRTRRLRDALFGILAREVREPLETIRRSAGRNGGGDAVRRESEGISRVVGDLLELADLDTGRTPWSLSEQSPDTILRDVFSRVESFAHARGIVLRHSAGESLPPVWSDRPRLVLALSRLAEWSILASPAGGIVEIRASAADGGVRIAVRSEGRGFTDRERRSLAPLLESARGDEEEISGFEIGLAVSLGVISHFGGSLSLEDGKRGFRECVISLPACRAAETAAGV